MVERAASVRETISRALNDRGLSNYMREAEPVVVALEEREVYLADMIADAAEDNGVGYGPAMTILREIGMSTPSSNGHNDNDDDDALTRIEHVLSTVTDELAQLRNRRR